MKIQNLMGLMLILILIFVAILSSMVYTSNVQKQYTEWCNNEMESNFNSIKQCIQDEQGTVEECFSSDWPEIEALYDKYNCSEISNQSINQSQVTDSNPITTVKDKILDDATRMAGEHEYIADVYDCTQFSETLRVHLLNEYGIQASRIIRAVNCSALYHGYRYWGESCEDFGGMHMFLKVPYNGSYFYIEATGGKEITSDMYYLYSVSYPLT